MQNVQAAVEQARARLEQIDAKIETARRRVGELTEAQEALNKEAANFEASAVRAVMNGEASKRAEIDRHAVSKRREAEQSLAATEALRREISTAQFDRAQAANELQNAQRQVDALSAAAVIVERCPVLQDALEALARADRGGQFGVLGVIESIVRNAKTSGAITSAPLLDLAALLRGQAMASLPGNEVSRRVTPAVAAPRDTLVIATGDFSYVESVSATAEVHRGAIAVLPAPVAAKAIALELAVGLPEPRALRVLVLRSGQIPIDDKVLYLDRGDERELDAAVARQLAKSGSIRIVGLGKVDLVAADEAAAQFRGPRRRQSPRVALGIVTEADVPAALSMPAKPSERPPSADPEAPNPQAPMSRRFARRLAAESAAI